MNKLTLTNQAADWSRLKALVLDSVPSPITSAALQARLGRVHRMVRSGAATGLYESDVNAWRAALEARGLGSVSINVRIKAVRKLAVEAADNGLLTPELAAGIARVKGVRFKGCGLETGYPFSRPKDF